MRSPERSTRLAAGLVAGALGLATAACGSGAGRTDDVPPLCTSANAYLWFGGELGGRSGMPSAHRAEHDLGQVRTALSELRRSAPAGMLDDIAFSQRVWADVDALLRRYDYGEGSQEMPPQVLPQLMARYQPGQEKGLRLTRYLIRRCARPPAPFPSAPAG